MSAIKVRCPDCDASIRHQVAEDHAAEVSLQCPKCGNEFTAEVEPNPAPAAATHQKPSNGSRRRLTAVENEPQTPRKKKKKGKQKPRSNTALIVGGIGAVVLVIGGIVAAVLAFGGPKNKATEVAKTDGKPGSETQSPAKPQPAQDTGSTAAGQKPPSAPVKPSGFGEIFGNGSGTTGHATGTVATPPTTQQASLNSAPVKPEEGPKLPPPPKLRLNSPGGLMGGTMVTAEQANTSPPLLPDEDPFVRASSFRSDGNLPKMAALPPLNQRPILALESGGHTDIIQNVFFTPAGDRLVTVGKDKTVRVWDIKKATTVNSFRFPSGPGEDGSLQAAALSSKGKLAVSGTPLTPLKANAAAQNIIYLVNLETGALIKTINAVSTVFSLSFSSDGTRLAAGCANGTVQVFDSTTGAQVGRNDSPQTGSIFEVRFSPETKSMVLGILTQTGLLRVVDLKNPTKNSSFNAQEVMPWSIAWSNDARFVAVGGHSGEIRIYDVGAKNEIRRFPARKVNNELLKIYQLQFLEGDTAIVCGGYPSWSAVITAESGKVKKEFLKHTKTVTSCCASADGKLVATCGGDQNEAYVWNPSTGQEVSRLSGIGKGIYAIGWSNDGKAIAWGVNRKTQDAYGNHPLEQIFRLDELGPGGPAFQMKFQQSQITDDTFKIVKRPALTKLGDVVFLLEVQVATRQPYLVDIPHEEIHSVTILPGRGKAVIGGEHGLYLFDLQTKEYKEFTGATGSILSVAPSPDGRYFVTGSSDQTIRIWKLEENDPVLSIFTVGRDWIAWTSQGYYSCSPHGEQLLAWQVNNGVNRLPQVYPAARFRPSMYQPAIVKYLVPAEGTQLAMAMAQKFDKALVGTTSVSEIVPPEATFDEESTKEAVINQDKFTVKATARGSAKQPITLMRLLVDGRPFQGQKEIKRFTTPSEVAEAAWVVPLSPGPHTIAVIAETPVSKGISRPLNITRQGEIPRPNLYVLAMGIADYPGKMKLNFSATDAELLANALKTHCQGAFGKIETLVLKDKQASLKGIQGGLDWLASKMTAQDVGIVSFSGHGMRDPANKFYMVTADINEKDPFHTCFAGDEFKARLDNMPGRLITVLDACHSGDVAERVRPASSDSLVQDLSSEDSGVIVMCASLGREYSYESPASKAGYFTLALVEGLSGHADIDEDGMVMINELDMYANYRVNEVSQGRQHSSTSMPAGMRPFPIATVPKKP